MAEPVRADTRRRRRALAAAIVAWTAIAWGGRIALLAGGEDPWAWVRVGGSVAVAVAAAAGLVLAPSARWSAWALSVFSIWTAVVWSRSLLVNWLGSGSFPFKVVHTVLAAGFFGLAWWAWRALSSSNRGDGLVDSHL